MTEHDHNLGPERQNAISNSEHSHSRVWAPGKKTDQSASFAIDCLCLGLAHSTPRRCHAGAEGARLVLSTDSLRGSTVRSSPILRARPPFTPSDTKKGRTLNVRARTVLYGDRDARTSVCLD